MKTAQFLERLDSYDEPITLNTLRRLMVALDIDSNELEDHLQFHPEKYQRNLLRRTDNYEALLLCFEAGQRTPIHDHAGSACGVRVIRGTGVETVFDQTPVGWLFPTGSHELPTGGVVGSNDMDIHQLSNLQAENGRLVTLHIYSPPLGEVGNYGITDNTVTQVRAPVATPAIMPK